MDSACKKQFADLSVNVPCRGKNTTLNDLRYELPCGFARFEFDIFNPAADIGEAIPSEIKEMIDSPVRGIHAHL